MGTKSKFIHPFLLAAYPVLALLAYNIEEIKVTAGLRALGVSLLLAAGLLLFFKLLLRDWDKAAIACSLSLILFFSYGHVYNALKQTSVLGFVPGRHRLLSLIWIGAFFIGLWWLRRKPIKTRGIHRLLNLVTAIAICFPLAQIGLYEARTISASSESAYPEDQFTSLNTPPGSTKPDIYYIILDAYARDDTLLNRFDLDNKPFLEQLQNLGFFVALCSQSNYAQTQLSLSSSLNLNYLHNLSDQFTPGHSSRVGISESIHHNAARGALEDLGYTSVAFETGFKVTQWEDADIYLSPSSGTLNQILLGGGITDFEMMLLRTSAGLFLIDSAHVLPAFIRPDFNNPRRIHRDRVLYVLDQLHQMPTRPGPKFVFAHLVIPHPPYVFGPNGEFTDFDKEDTSGYRDQVLYLNSQLIPLLEEIITSSKTPPIIILQADHGAINAPPKERLNILNAYYFPHGGDQGLYENISPVNTFRLLFDTYFGGRFGLLDDTSYFSVYSTPYDYTVIPNNRSGCVK